MTKKRYSITYWGHRPWAKYLVISLNFSFFLRERNCILFSLNFHNSRGRLSSPLGRRGHWDSESLRRRPELSSLVAELGFEPRRILRVHAQNGIPLLQFRFKMATLNSSIPMDSPNLQQHMKWFPLKKKKNPPKLAERHLHIRRMAENPTSMQHNNLKAFFSNARQSTGSETVWGDDSR